LEVGGVLPNKKNQNNLIPICSTAKATPWNYVHAAQRKNSEKKINQKVNLKIPARYSVGKLKLFSFRFLELEVQVSKSSTGTYQVPKQF
jgi:hypothetical protein